MILDGKKVAQTKLELLKQEIANLKDQLGLAVIEVGDNPASHIYIRQKYQVATELGYNFWHYSYPQDIKEEDIIVKIKELNNDDHVHGIIVETPLPSHLNFSHIQNAISPSKDVDGLSTINSGLLMHQERCLVPCTAQGIIDLLDAYAINLSGVDITIIGRSHLVGRPLSNLLINRNATVTLCHSHTKDISKFTKNADIVIVAVGHKHFLTADMVKDDAIVIDVGINRENHQIYGDADYQNLINKCRYITPVPGGVGPMTVYELMHNVYLAYQFKNQN